MTTLGGLFKAKVTIPGLLNDAPAVVAVGNIPPAGPVTAALVGRANGKTSAQQLDLPGIAVSLAHLTASAGSPGPLGSGPAILASLVAWANQDDDAHEMCSLVACRTPLHPGPCKGWKHTLHANAPHIWQQMEDERVRKANERRIKRIGDLKAQNKPIPRRLLTEIKARSAPAGQHPASNVTPVPLGKVGQKADLAGGQAHHAGQAVSNAAGVVPNQAPALPLGPKGKKPTVAGRGPAFVITQPKVTDTYKLDKAAKLTPAEWDALTPGDKKAIRDELEAIKVRGFGPQQKKADELLAKLPAANTIGNLPKGTPGTITTPSGQTYQKVSAPNSIANVAAQLGQNKAAGQAKAAQALQQSLANPKITQLHNAPGKVNLGQAVKPAAPNAPGTAAHVQHARAVVNRTAPKAAMGKTHVDAYGKLTKAEFDALPADEQKTIRDDLANAKAKFLDPKKQQVAKDLLDRFGSLHPVSAPAASSGTTTMTPTNVAAKIRKDGSADLILGGKKVTVGFHGQGHDGTLIMLPGGHYTVTTKDGTKHHLAKGQSVTVALTSTPNGAKGYSDPQNELVKSATSGLISTDDILKNTARLTPDQVAKLDDADRKAVLGRLAFIATHRQATQEQRDRAAAYGRIINGGTHVPASQKFDHAPSIGELHREEQKGGHAVIADALAAASTSSAPSASRIAALSALTKPQFDSLPAADQRKITDALQGLHYTPGGSSNAPTVDKTVGDAITKYTGLHPGVHRIKQAETDFRAGKIDGDKVHNEFIHARVQAPGTTDKAGQAAVIAEGARVAKDNPTLPPYTRVRLAGDQQYGNAAYDAISLAGMKHNWEAAPRFSSHDLDSLFRATEADLAKTDPIHAQAVRDLQDHVLTTGLRGQPGVPSGSPWSQATRNAAVDAALRTDRHGSVPQEGLDRYKALSPAAREGIRHTLADRLAQQTDPHAQTATWLTLRDINSMQALDPATHAAVLQATDRYGLTGKLDAYRALDPVEFRRLPDFTQNAIKKDLDDFQKRAEATANGGHVWMPTDNPFKVFPAALAGNLTGDREKHQDRGVRNAIDVAKYGTKIVSPASRVNVYSQVSSSALANALPSDRLKIENDLGSISHDASLPLLTRYEAQFAKDVRLQGHTFQGQQLRAVEHADPHPGGRYSDADAYAAFDKLDKADYDALDPTFRAAIDERINSLPGLPQQTLTAKFHPAAAAANPSGMTPTTAQANIPPHVQAALDTIYGVHPKSHTMAHQLSTYGALRGHDFAQLNSQEQGHLLSDLSFIQTTAKGPSGDKARKLIDRFTPPGTPSGQLPVGAVIPPANAVPGQVRYATPLVGLEKAKDSGKSGDGWISLPGGGRVWGAHGAAGLMLMHQDPATGEKRYLMVQRGPAISDPGKWTFPGGAIDSKETPHQGAARETIEELGLKDDVLKDALVHGDHTFTVPGSTWKYTTVAAQVPSMIKPNLSTAHARAETSDAKWMTEAEIKALDTAGKLHHPIAGGKLEQNVLSLYPAAAQPGTKLGQIARPGPISKRQGRLTMPSGGRQAPANFNAWPHAHKPSTGKNLVGDKAAIDFQRQKIKQDRALYDGKTADGRLAAIGAQQGFDALPTVMDKKDIDRLLATGDYIEAWRGVQGAGGWSARSRGGAGGKTAAEINEEMRTGPAYYGKGIFGNGYYLATDKSVATQYADGTKGSVVRMLIPKTALTEKYDKVEREAQANSSRVSKAKGASSYELSTFWDPGRWGAAKGLDGIEINPNMRAHGGGGSNHVAKPGKPAFNWLNRSVLIIQKEPG